MKIFNKRSTRILMVALTVFVIQSCKKEESLSPNTDAANRQKAGIDFLNNGGEVNTGGTTTGGNNANITQSFRATIDGKTTIFPQYSYLRSQLATQVTGSNSTNSSAITLTIGSSFSQGDTIDLSGSLDGATYVPMAATAYPATDGQIIIDSNTTTFIQGRFDFSAEDAANSTTVAITKGTFKISK